MELCNTFLIEESKMDEEAKIDTVVVYEFKSQKERDDFELSAQWIEDKEKFKKLITPTNLTELII
jgi:hypothetical protein